jgi:N-acetylglucosamine-6-sulfatase
MAALPVVGACGIMAAWDGVPVRRRSRTTQTDTQAMLRSAIFLLLSLLIISQATAADRSELRLDRREGVQPRNIVLILIDDFRYDAMGFMGHPFLETPHIDRLAKGGVNFTAAYVTTSLCSPSRASVLTGQYAHKHRVVDNNNPVPPGTLFFPQYLQAAGYRTGFFGKWHMGGGSDDPRPGFDRWVSFRGQGSYLPNKSGLNIDGKKVPQKGYITDELTDYAVDWLGGLDKEKPFFLYLSHKAVHADFVPAKRHKGRYADAKVTPPPTMARTEENYRGKPMWVWNQRNSWHGVEFPYHSTLDVAEYYRRYCETLLSVDDSVGRVLTALDEKGVLDSTLVLFMGDNGFCFGEHGLIDKRHAYEASMRIPFVAHCPERLPAGETCGRVVANIDVAPTFLHAAGLVAPEQMDGRSFLDVAAGKDVPWRDALLYEYYWERNFPQTPTMHALRTGRYKYIRYFGLWDTDELYDMQQDPHEQHNLIREPEHQKLVRELNDRLFKELEATDGMYIPLSRTPLNSANLREADGSKAAEFPDYLLRDLPDDEGRSK